MFAELSVKLVSLAIFRHLKSVSKLFIFSNKYAGSSFEQNLPPKWIFEQNAPTLIKLLAVDNR